jgi:GNAT superfamily N-acetyltransferase
MRRMLRAELDLVVGWAATEGWNPGLADAESFFATDPGGFFLGVLDGEPVASISIVRYDAAYAFLGFYIVSPAHRGTGLGMRLWRFAMERVEAETIGLDGVISQMAMYERSGFSLAFRSSRCTTVTRPARGSDVATAGEADLPEILAYDEDVFGHPRSGFISRWVGEPAAHTVLAHEDGRLTGYGVIRPAFDGYRLGPVFADTRAVAEQIVDGLLGAVPAGERAAIDAPGSNAEALALVSARAMVPVFETARMYRGASPDHEMSRVFGITSFELG